jgi:hypothetical protein
MFLMNKNGDFNKGAIKSKIRLIKAFFVGGTTGDQT